jgi:hypothetical protein
MCGKWSRRGVQDAAGTCDVAVSGSRDFVVTLREQGFKAMCLNEYADLVFENSEGVKCTELMSVAEQSGGADSTGGRWGGAQNSSAGLDCAFVNGKQVLDLLTFSTGSIGECMLYLLFIAAGVHAMAYLCLVRQAQRFQPLEPIPRQGSDVSVVSSTSAV